MSLAALWSIPSVRLDRVEWYRAIPSKLALARAVPPPGFTHGTASRFSAGNLQAVQHRFDTLYFAEDARTCLYETGALLGTPFRPGWSIANKHRAVRVVRFLLKDDVRIVDLTDPALGLSAQTSTGDWEGYRHRPWAPNLKLPIGIARTQRIGRMLYARFVDRQDLHGFVSISARVPTRRVLVIFDPHDERGERDILGQASDREEVDLEEILGPISSADPRREHL